MPIPRGMNNVIQYKIAEFYHKRLALYGEKFDRKQGLEAKILDGTCKPENLIEEALKWARKIAPKGEPRTAFKAIRQVMYESVIYDCTYQSLDRLGTRTKVEPLIKAKL